MAAKRSKKKRKRRAKAYAVRTVFAFAAVSLVLLLGFGVLKLVQRIQPGGMEGTSGDTIEVKKDGTVLGYIEEDFSRDYYETEGLRSMIESEIAEYAQISGSQTCVELKDFEVENGMVNVLIAYESAQDYRSYNNTMLYVGSVAELSGQGVSFAMPLLSVDKEKGSLTEGDLLSAGDHHAVVFNENVSVKVPGNILYHSENVSLTGRKTAAADGDSTESAVIIYQ